MTTPTIAQINQLIQTFGPVMRIHPKEKYLMDDPEPFLATGLNSLSFGLIKDEDEYDTFEVSDQGTIAVSSGQTLLDAVTTAKQQGQTLLDAAKRAKQDPKADDPVFRYWLQVSDTLKPGNPGNMARAKAQVCVKRGVSDATFDLQFWYFYGFNGPGKFRVTVGNVMNDSVEMDTAGRHYGDWEHVTLRMVLGQNGWQIRSVYLSRHSFTVWVLDLSELQFSGKHPIIYVGRDSHAHYSSAGTHYYMRPWSKSFGVGTAAVDLYDLTADGGIEFDASTHYAVMSSDFADHEVMLPAWSSFDGRWGQYERLKFSYDLKVYTYDFKEVGSGPTGPLQHTVDGLAAEWAAANMNQGHGAVAWLTGNFSGGSQAQLAQCWGNGSSLGMFLYGSDGVGGLKQLWGSENVGEGHGAVAWLVGDFNGDRKAEIVQCWGAGDGLGMTMYGFDGGSGLKTLWKADKMPDEGHGAVAWLVGDFNGDGRAEIVQCWGAGDGLGMTMYGFNDGSGLQNIPPAARGLFGVGGLQRLWKADKMPDEGHGAVAWLVGDFNGDGRAEIVQCWGAGDGLGMTMYGFNDGSGLQNIPPAARGLFGVGGLRRLWRADKMPDEGHGAVAWLVGDFKGDGKAEIVQCWGAGDGLGMTMYGFDGGSGLKKLWKGDKMPDDEGHGAVAWLVGDFKGDGKADIVQAWGAGDGLGMTMYGFDDGSGLENIPPAARGLFGGPGIKKLWKSDNMEQGHGAVTWQVGNFTGLGSAQQIVQGFGNGSSLGMNLYSKATE
jgi:hypothetical protein